MSTTYTLKYPVELKNSSGEVLETITELQMSRFNGKAMREIGNAKQRGEGEVMAVMICKSAGIPPSTFDQLDGEDVADAGLIAAGFIGGGPQTGAM